MIFGMGRPEGGYRDDTCRRVPSVTTVISATEAAGPGLERWLMRHGMAAADMRERAAARGSLVHTAIEAALRADDAGDDWDAAATRVVDEAFELDDVADEAVVGIHAWCAWWREWRGGVDLIAAEVPCVHPECGFGGTPDLVALVGGRPVVVDWKTSSATRTSHVVQVAAYAMLVERCGLVADEIDEAIIVRIPCDGHSVEEVVVSGSHLSLARVEFLRRLDSYRWARDTRRALGVR